MSEIKLHHIRDVVAVAEAGSLRAAARVLGIAQPSLTRSIREVEQHLGAALFERGAKGATPTPAGVAFLRRANLVQSELARARDEVAQLTGSEVGRVAIGLSTVAHLALLPRALASFRTRYPRVDLTVLEGLYVRSQQMLEDGRLDFYIGPLGEGPLASGLSAELLFENERVVFCRGGHPLADATSLRDLVEASWISTSVTLDSDRELGPLFALHGLPAPRVAMHSHSALTTMLSAAHSDLLTMLPRQWLDFPAVPNLLHALPIKERLPAPSIHLVRRRRLPLTPAAEHLRDLLCRAAARQTR